MTDFLNYIRYYFYKVLGYHFLNFYLYLKLILVKILIFSPKYLQKLQAPKGVLTENSQDFFRDKTIYILSGIILVKF